MMRRRPFRLLRLGVVSIIGLALLAAPAPAQEQKPPPFREPGISFKTERKPYIEWIAGVLIVMACLIIAFKNPHRSHLD